MDYLDEILGDGVETQQSNLMVPTLLVDTSYICYHSMFSAWKTFKDQYGDLCPTEPDPNFDPATIPEFKHLLRERFERAVMTAPLKVHPFIEHKNIIFARDCPKSKIWRIDYYKEYKQERRDAKDSERPFAFGGSFNTIYNEIVPDFIDEGAILVAAPCSEGDDVIATLIKNKVSDKFIVLASDRDLLQLVNNDVTMVDASGKVITYSLELELPEEELEKIDFNGKHYIFIKALMGDKSDGITQIHKRCGKKTAIKYFFDKGLLKEKMDADPKISNIIKTNLSIMDFDYIPSEINDAIMEEYKKQRAE
jgi:5'-3' exonuclease